MPFLQFDPVTAAITGGAALAGGILGKKKAKTTQVSTVSPEQQRVLNPLTAYLEGRVGKGLPRFEGDRVVGLSDPEQQSLGLLSDFLSSESALAQPTLGALTQILGGQPTTQVNEGITRDFFQRSIREPALRRFEEETLPLLREAYVGPGLSQSTARQEGERRSRRDLEESLLAKELELVYRDEQERRGLAESAAERQVRGVGLAPAATTTVEEAPLRRAEAGQRLGALPRVIEQAELDFEFNEFVRTTPELSPVIEQALAFLGIPMQASFFQPGRTFGEGALQGGALAASLALGRI